MIEVVDLTKQYKKNIGIKNISFTVKAGDVIGFIGPNGCGKTTLLRALVNLEKADDGEVVILGESINDNGFKSALKEVGYLSKDMRFKSKSIVKDLLMKFIKTKNADEVYVYNLVERFELNINKKVNKLSSDEHRKLSLIITLMNQPKILILEEPTKGLDPFMQELVYEIILQEKAKNTTILLTSNCISEVERLCSRIIYLKSGEIVLDQDIDLLRKESYKVVKVMNTNHILLLKDLVLEGFDENGYVYRYTGKMDKLLKYLLDFNIYSFTIEDVGLFNIIKKYHNI